MHYDGNDHMYTHTTFRFSTYKEMQSYTIRPW